MRQRRGHIHQLFHHLRSKLHRALRDDKKTASCSTFCGTEASSVGNEGAHVRPLLHVAPQSPTDHFFAQLPGHSTQRSIDYFALKRRQVTFTMNVTNAIFHVDETTKKCTCNCRKNSDGDRDAADMCRAAGR